MSILQNLSSLLSLIVPIAVLIASIYFISKKQEPEALLILAGSILRFLNQLFFSISNILIMINGFHLYDRRLLLGFINALGFLGAICFAIGFILLIVNYVKTSGDNKE